MAQTSACPETGSDGSYRRVGRGQFLQRAVASRRPGDARRHALLSLVGIRAKLLRLRPPPASARLEHPRSRPHGG